MSSGVNQLSFEALNPVWAELSRGADPEVMRDIDPSIAEGAEWYSEPEMTEEDEQELAEMLVRQEAEHEALIESKAKEDALQATTRQMYLFKLIAEVGTQRKMEGFAVNHERTPNYRGAVEEKNQVMQGRVAETLARACGACTLECAIRNQPAQWVATHPYAKSDRKPKYHWMRHPKVKQTEGRMKFAKRLDKDPMAHCIPGEDIEQSTPQAA